MLVLFLWKPASATEQKQKKRLLRLFISQFRLFFLPILNCEVNSENISAPPPPSSSSKLDFSQFCEKSQNCEIKSRINLFYFLFSGGNELHILQLKFISNNVLVLVSVLVNYNHPEWLSMENA